MADPPDTSNGAPDGAPAPLEKPEPAGYYEGESMTRRTVFAVGGQALGGIAGLAVALPAIGFAMAPLFEEEGNDWQAVGPVSTTSPRTPTSR